MDIIEATDNGLTTLEMKKQKTPLKIVKKTVIDVFQCIDDSLKQNCKC